ncbi:DUF4147 domain-containing protein, partial [bacterium]|nr:DUF4147 domain-containing protein [bacterium]
AIRRDGVKLQIEALNSQISVDLAEFENVYLIGGGKAGAKMAESLTDAIGHERISGGAIAVPLGSVLPNLPAGVRVIEATHPFPSDAAAAGAESMLATAEEAGENDLVIFLLSGGASAMIPLPAAPVTITDKVQTTKVLLASGATIDEINAIRKHISMIKGGQLAKAAFPARVISLIVSDVIGDDLESIGSGPTIPNSTTFADCLEIVRRLKLSRKLPKSVLKRLRDGGLGKFAGPEDIPADLFKRCDNIVVCNNDLALIACDAAARKLGYAPLNLGSRVFGEAREVAKVLVGIAVSARRSGRPIDPPCCFIAGGELTVTLRGDGAGGRNQEFVLSAALHLRGAEGIVVLSAGTDGIDGSSDAAGAIADGRTFQLGQMEGMDAADYLERNDSFSFFDSLGDTIVTGRTGTNVMDIRLLLVDSGA